MPRKKKVANAGDVCVQAGQEILPFLARLDDAEYSFLIRKAERAPLTLRGGMPGVIEVPTHSAGLTLVSYTRETARDPVLLLEARPARVLLEKEHSPDAAEPSGANHAHGSEKHDGAAWLYYRIGLAASLTSGCAYVADHRVVIQESIGSALLWLYVQVAPVL